MAVETWLRAAVGIAAVLLASGCSETSHGQHVAVRILDDTHLQLNATPCPEDLMKVSVTERPDEVAVKLTFTVNPDAKCAGIAHATLTAPLGDRVLVNANTGLPLVVLEDLRCSPSVSFQRCDGVTVGTDPG